VSYRRRTKPSYALKKHASAGSSITSRFRLPPPGSRYGLCPACESEERKKHPPPPPPGGEPPKGKPPKIVEIKPSAPRTRGGGGGKPQKKPSSKEGNGSQGKKKQQKSTERGEKEGKQRKGQEGQGRSGGGKGGGEGRGGEAKPKLPFNVTPEDVVKAREASEQVEKEFEKAEKVKVDKTTPMFEPVGAAGAPSLYRDQSFISKMRTALRKWRTGYETEARPTGSRFKVKEYIRSKEKKPFITRRIKSAKGRKILVLADFSGSIALEQEKYKKALISAMEVLDSIETKTAFFAFGGDLSGSVGFFKIKKFEQPRWKPIHSAKVAALIADGGTPTAEAYMGLENYIRKERPDVVLTVTDGRPNNNTKTAQMVKKLKRYSRMVAFSIGETPHSAKYLQDSLKQFGYNKTFAVSSMTQLPKKLVDLIAPT